MRRRTRYAAMAAAAGMLAGGVITGTALVAYADEVVEFTTPADGAQPVWTATPFAFEGTTTNLVDDVLVLNYVGGSPDPLCFDDPDPVTGAWSCVPAFPLEPDDYEDVRAEQGLNSDSVAFQVLLPRPGVTTPSPSHVPYGGTATFGGTVDYPVGQVHVSIPALPGLECTDVIAAAGPWECDIPFDEEPPGEYTVEITHTNGSAPTQSPATLDLVIGAEPPATPVIDSPLEGSELIGDTDPAYLVVSGRAPVGTPLDVELDGAVVCDDVTVDYNAQWTCSTGPAPGVHELVARQGATASDPVAFEVLTPAPSVGGLPLSGENDEFDYTIGGQGLAGHEVFASLSDGFWVDQCSATVGVGGFWSCDLDLRIFDPGPATLEVEQWEIPDDPNTRSQVASYPFTVLPAAPDNAGPHLACAFSPAGVSITSGDPAYAYISWIEPTESSKYSELGYPGSCNGDPGYLAPDVEGWDWWGFVATCDTLPCAAADLEPGLYTVSYGWNDESSYDEFDYLFRVPETPAITAAVSTTSSVVLRGTATAGDAIRIERSNGATLCTTSATSAGEWACQFPRSTATSARAIALDPQSGGLSLRTAARSIPVAIVPPTEDAAALVTWFLEFDGDLMNLRPGDTFTINISGMPEGTEIEVWMHSTPRLLGTAVGTGQPMALDLTVPEDIEPGAHEIEIIGTTPLGTVYTFSSDAMVTGDPLPAEEEPEDDPTVELGAGPGERGDPAAPSALSGALPTLDTIVRNPLTIAIAGGLALALLFLVALPTELLNSSLSANTSRLGRVYGSIDAFLTGLQARFIALTRSRALAAALITTIVAIVFGFVDPGFGFDLVSLRLVLSLGIAFFVLSYGAAWLSGLIIRRAWGASGIIELQPSIIVFAILGVVLARLLDFSPGFLVGIAIGLELVAASRRVAARAVLVQFLVVVGLAVAAWVGYSLFTPGDDFAGMLLDDTLVAVTAEGLTGALVAVFPLRFLDGRELWLESKALWVAAFLVVAVPFALLVLPTAVEGTAVSDYGVWLLVFAAFGLLCLLGWLLLARAARREEAAERETVDA